MPSRTLRGLVAAAAVLAASGRVDAQSVPSARKVIVENQRVVVLDLNGPAIATIPAADKLDAVTVSLADGPPGAVEFAAGGAASKTRASGAGARAIVVELKPGSVPSFTNTAGVALAFPRPGSKKVFENDRVVVWDYTWTAGVATPVHFHDKDVVVVYLADGALTSTTPDGVSTVNEHFFGYAKFNPGNRVHFEVLSRGQARAIIVELK